MNRKLLSTLPLYVMLLCATALATPKEDGDKGMAEFAAGNLIDAINLLTSAAEGGYAAAQARLGYILDQGEENEAAFNWFQQAAEQHNAEGQYGLGSMYAKGEGVEKKPQEAVRWIRLAAEQEYIPAMRTYASALEKGVLSMRVDYEQAVVWFTRAAKQGDAVSIHRLANAYREGDLGLQIDLEQAAYWQAFAPGE